MTERPFIHKSAFSNVKSNFMFQDELAKIFLKVIDKKGIINIEENLNLYINLLKKIKKKLRKNLKG